MIMGNWFVAFFGHKTRLLIGILNVNTLNRTRANNMRSRHFRPLFRVL
jgi:hypothetical protein